MDMLTTLQRVFFIEAMSSRYRRRHTASRAFISPCPRKVNNLRYRVNLLSRQSQPKTYKKCHRITVYSYFFSICATIDDINYIYKYINNIYNILYILLKISLTFTAHKISILK